MRQKLDSAGQDREGSIVWAFDPTQNPKQALNLVKELKIWSKRTNNPVQPVCVLSQSALNFPAKVTFPWKERIENESKKYVEKFLKIVKATDFLTPKIIYLPTISKRKMASELTKYAEKIRAKLIFANTHIKKPWNQFRIGSFAETLVATSSIPILLFNPLLKPSEKIPTILFPTDFSRECKNALVSLEPLAKAFNSKVVLYNQIETSSIYPIVNNGGVWPAPGIDLAEIENDIKNKRVKKAKKLATLIQHENIATKIQFQKQKKDLATEIINASKTNDASLIAITNHSGPVAQALLGGVVQDVLLKAKCPVLVYHKPKAHRSQGLMN